MRIEQAHRLGSREAIRRIDRFLDELMARPPAGGIAIRDARKDWDGPRMQFSFTAAKGLFGTTIAGGIEVADDRVVLEAELPGIVKGLVGEQKVIDVVSRELGTVLERP